MTESQQLLAEFVRTRSEEAFRELITRYVDLVYSAALRLVQGDAERARDVAQTVFADLARMAPQLSRNSMLGGWLHRRACFVAMTLMRSERRRQARERQAVEMSALEDQPDNVLAEFAPVLDEAINELGADDRDVILLRFFEQRSLRSVGDALGTSENVAQKRVARAVQELSLLLKQRGYTLPAAVLASGLAAGAVNAAPPGLALTFAKGALAGSSVSITAASAKTLALTKLKIEVAGALILLGIGTALWLRHAERHQPRPGAQLAQTQAEEGPTGAPELLPGTETDAPSAGAEPAPTIPQIPAAPAAAANLIPEPSPAPPTQIGTALPLPPPGGAPLRRLYSQPGSQLRIEGTNNATRRAWQAESRVIEGFLDVEPAALIGSTRAQFPAQAQVSVPIHSIQSVDANGRPYSDALDKAWYAALKATGDPEAKVTFHLSSVTRRGVAAGDRAEGNSDATGELVLASVTNHVTMLIRILRLDGDQLKVSGTTSLRWVSEQVDPFSIVTPQGQFSPDFRVTVRFEWLLGPTNISITAAQEGLVPLYLNLPTPTFRAPPRGIQLGSYVETFPEMPRAPMLVPPGLTNLARQAKVTSSDRNAGSQALAKIVDGDKEGADESIVYLRKGTQWVALDLGSPQEIFAVVLWHAHNAAKVYHDVVVRVADDPECRVNVRTLFNNDQDNSSGLGKGTDREYFETNEGKLIDARGVRARFLRFYSKGSTESALNEYTEIEVYGRIGHAVR